MLVTVVYRKNLANFPTDSVAHSADYGKQTPHCNIKRVSAVSIKQRNRTVWVHSFALKERLETMNCAFCQRTNDAEAIFCAYCGIRMETLPTPIAPASPPATGATIDLGRAAPAQPTTPPMPTIKPVAPPPLGRMPAPVATWQRGHSGSCGRNRHTSWLGPMLLGLGALFVLKNLWGFLLPVGLISLGAMMLVQSQAHQRWQRRDKRAAVWLVGIGIMLVTNWWGPGIFLTWWLASSIK